MYVDYVFVLVLLLFNNNWSTQHYLDIFTANL